MKEHEKPGKPVTVTVQTLEERKAELSKHYNALESGEEKDLVNQQIQETGALIAQLSFYGLTHKLHVKGIVEKKTKI